MDDNLTSAEKALLNAFAGFMAGTYKLPPATAVTVVDKFEQEFNIDPLSERIRIERVAAEYEAGRL